MLEITLLVVLTHHNAEELIRGGYALGGYLNNA